MASKKSGRGISRRNFMKFAGGGGLLTSVLGPAFLFPERAVAQQKTLKILQWSHFVPAYDTWFDGIFAKQWGEKHNTNVVVDHINLVDLNARAASEAQAKKGHDLFMFLSPPVAYDNHVIDMTDVYLEVEKKHGKKIELAHKSTYNPRAKRYYAFSDSFAPNAGSWRQDLWRQVNFESGPDTYEELRRGAKSIKERFGQPCGLGLAEEPNSSLSLRALLWSFGGTEQNEGSQIVIDSKETVEALKYMKALYEESETPEVFTWTPPSNSRAIWAGKASYVSKDISVSRGAELRNLGIKKDLGISRALGGPKYRLAPQQNMNCYVIWEFAQNKEGAQQFLIDYMDNFHAAFWEGGFYNFPCFPQTVPNLKQELKTDTRSTASPHNEPSAEPYYMHASFSNSALAVKNSAVLDRPGQVGKYAVLADAHLWVKNIGHPGYASPAMNEAFTSWVIPQMFASVAQGKERPEDAAKTAQSEYERIFEKFGGDGFQGGGPKPTPTPGYR